MNDEIESLSTKHLDAELIPYLEDALLPADRERIEDHLRSCAECAEEVEALRGIHRVLHTRKKEVFCPETWELHEFVRTGEDPKGKFSAHLHECPLCREEVTAYRQAWGEASSQAPMPSAIRAAFEKHSSQPRRMPGYDTREYLSSLWDSFSVVFRQPALALATAAAAALLVVVLYPREGTVPVVPGEKMVSQIVFSSSPWMGMDSSRPVMPVTPEVKPRVAMLMVLTGFMYELPQDRIDSLYDALSLNPAVKEQFEVLNPGQVGDFVRHRSTSPADVKALAVWLHEELGVSKVLLLTLVSRGKRYGIEGQIIDTRTGGIVSRTPERLVTEAEIPAKLNESGIALLESTPSER